MTTNPKKVSRLEVYGLTVVEQPPIVIEPTEHNREHLRTKRKKMGHLLPDV